MSDAGWEMLIMHFLQILNNLYTVIDLLLSTEIILVVSIKKRTSLVCFVL